MSFRASLIFDEARNLVFLSKFTSEISLPPRRDRNDNTTIIFQKSLYMTKSLFLFLPFLLFAQTDTDFSIRILQDKRVENSSELYSFLRSSTDRERELALLSIANIQDTNGIEYVAPLLYDDSPRVRLMAAFALGMSGQPKAASSLFRRLAVERNDKCIAEMFNAIGLCGDVDDLKRIIKQTESYPAKWRTHVAVCIMRFGNRRVKEIAATKYLATLLGDKTTIINATYALMRIGDTTVNNNNRDQLHENISNSSSLIRMWTATMLGTLDDDTSLEKLLNVAKKDKDWRVRVNAIRSLRKREMYRNELINLFADKNEHVALTAVTAYDVMCASDTVFTDSAKILPMLHSNIYAVSVKEELRKMTGKKLGERAIPIIGSWRSDQPFVSAQRVRAFGETRSMRAIPMIKEAIQQSNHSLVVIAGIESYQTIAQQSDETVKNAFLKTITPLFSKKDAGISFSIAVAFQDTAFTKESRTAYLPHLVSSYQTMNAAADLEPMVELLNVFGELGDSSALQAIEQGLEEEDKVIRTAAEKAYKAMTGEDSPVRFIKNPDEYKPFYKPENLKLLSKYKGAEIFTSKGMIKVIFEKEFAPFTVLNFILLAQKKFYDGLSFHRVVSNFVIQGGDPLGNGSGGPNYAIRSEVHPNAKYRTGSVGMASAGKDTEGSQWFITHCPAPHLDYRYTIFGYTKDTAVVDKIMVGDRIEKVVLF